METVNGTSEENTSRRHDYLRCPDEQNSLGQLGDYSYQSRNRQQGGLAENDSEWRSTSGQYADEGDTPIGKILQRLELVERSHKQYVRAHQTRLKARLDESENLEQLFDESVAELRQEIYELATQVNQTNGNGHK